MNYRYFSRDVPGTTSHGVLVWGTVRLRDGSTGWYFFWFGWGDHGPLLSALTHILYRTWLVEQITKAFPGSVRLTPSTPEQRRVAEEMLRLEDSVHMDIRTLTMSTIPYEIISKGAGTRVEKYGASPGSKTVGGRVEAEVGGQSVSAQVEFWRSLVAKPFSEAEKQASKDRILKIMDRAQGLLGEKRYLLGEELSVLDIAWFITMDRFKRVAQHDFAPSHPKLNRLYQELLARPAFAAETENKPGANNVGGQTKTKL